MNRDEENKIYEWAEKVRQTNYLEFTALEPEVKKTWWKVQQRLDGIEPEEKKSWFRRLLEKLGR